MFIHHYLHPGLDVLDLLLRPPAPRAQHLPPSIPHARFSGRCCRPRGRGRGACAIATTTTTTTGVFIGTATHRHRPLAAIAAPAPAPAPSPSPPPSPPLPSPASSHSPLPLPPPPTPPHRTFPCVGTGIRYPRAQPSPAAASTEVQLYAVWPRGRHRR